MQNVVTVTSGAYEPHLSYKLNFPSVLLAFARGSEGASANATYFSLAPKHYALLPSPVSLGS